MKTVKFGILTMSIICHCIPSIHKQIKISVHILFELTDALGGKSMGNGLALSGMFGTIPSVE